MSNGDGSGEQEDVRACDFPRCRSRGASVKPYVVDYEDGRLRVDLCRKHGRDLRDLRDAMSEMFRAFNQATPRGHSSTPVDPTEMPDDL